LYSSYETTSHPLLVYIESYGVRKTKAYCNWLVESVNRHDEKAIIFLKKSSNVFSYLK